MTEQRWIFVIRVIHKVGVLNAVTGVFSSWGISLQTAMLNTMGPMGSNIIILSFSCSHRKKEIMERTVKRLACVNGLTAYPYETNDLRMIAAFTVSENHRHNENKSVRIEEHIREDNSKTLYVSGTVMAVDTYITPMLKNEELQDLIRTILPT